MVYFIEGLDSDFRDFFTKFLIFCGEILVVEEESDNDEYHREEVKPIVRRESE